MLESIVSVSPRLTVLCNFYRWWIDISVHVQGNPTVCPPVMSWSLALSKGEYYWLWSWCVILNAIYNCLRLKDDSVNFAHFLQEGFAFSHCTTCKAQFHLRVELFADNSWRKIKFRLFVARDVFLVFLAVQTVRIAQMCSLKQKCQYRMKSFFLWILWIQFQFNWSIYKENYPSVRWGLVKLYLKLLLFQRLYLGNLIWCYKNLILIYFFCQ